MLYLYNSKYSSKGFTLIELLVVVLIIGILASIALPQYRIAVAKARYTQAMAVADAMWQAQQTHKMSTGSWATDFDTLDISLPSGSTNMNPEHTKIWYSWGTCWFSPNPNTNSGLKEVYCRVLDDSLALLRNYTNQTRYCRAYYNTSQGEIAEKVCKSMGTYEREDSGEGWRQYIIP